MTRSTNLCSRNHPTLFLIKKRRSIDGAGGVLYKKLFVKISHYSEESTCVEIFFCKKRLYQKDTPTQMFSCEYCEISENTYFEDYLGTAASEVSLESDCLGLFFWTVVSKPS